MRHLFRFFLLIFVGLTAVSCADNRSGGLPTQVPTAAVPEGPVGTNALNFPFQTAESLETGLRIEYPTDWQAREFSDHIRLIPVQSGTASLLTTAASVTDLPDADPNTSVLALLESIITDPSLAPPDSITRIAEPTAVTIKDYSGAAAQVQVIPPDLSLIEGDPNLEGNAPIPAPETLHLYFVILRHNQRTILFSGTTETTTVDIYLPVFERLVSTIEINDPQ